MHFKFKELCKNIEKSEKIFKGDHTYKYLKKRSIRSPENLYCIENALAYNSELRNNLPCMVAQITSYEHDKLVGIQITYLDDFGRKNNCIRLNKKTHGKIKGGSIRLQQSKSNEIHFAEGFETIASVMQSLNIDASFHALCGLNVPPIEFIKNKVIHLWTDKDLSKAGFKFGEDFKDKLIKHTKELYIHHPMGEISKKKKSLDYNDIIQSHDGVNSIIYQYQNDLQADLPQIWSFGSFMKQEFVENSPIISGLIHRTETIALTGKAKTGKSGFVLNIIKSISENQDFLSTFSITNTNLKILYLNGEISEGALQDRLQNVFELEALNFDFDICSETLDFLKPSNTKTLDKILKIKEYDLCIVDPFYKFFSGDEMNHRDMKLCLGNIIEIIRNNKCACLLICHEGKTNESERSNSSVGHKIRGSSAFADAVDGTIQLVKVNDQEYKLRSEFRNRESFDEIKLARDGLIFRHTGISSKPTDKSKEVIKDILLEHPQGLTVKEIISYYAKFPGSPERGKNSIRNDLTSMDGVQILGSHPKVYKIEIPKFHPPIGIEKLENHSMS